MGMVTEFQLASLHDRLGKLLALFARPRHRSAAVEGSGARVLRVRVARRASDGRHRSARPSRGGGASVEPGDRERLDAAQGRRGGTQLRGPSASAAARGRGRIADRPRDPHRAVHASGAVQARRLAALGARAADHDRGCTGVRAECGGSTRARGAALRMVARDGLRCVAHAARRRAHRRHECAGLEGARGARDERLVAPPAATGHFAWRATSRE